MSKRKEMVDTIRLDVKGLEALMKAFKKPPVARVGVLGTKDKRSLGSGRSNATIGMKHEYGMDGLPVRSFLRMPLTENLMKYLEKERAFSDEVIREIIDEKSLRAWLALIGATAEEVISDAFATGGFGKWEPSNMDRKKVKQTLVETTQLRDSITSDVK